MENNKCANCNGCKWVRSFVPSRATGYLDRICFVCKGTGFQPPPIIEKPPLPFDSIKEHLGELNWILKDYDISIEATVENGNVVLQDGLPVINIGKAHKWTT